MGRLQDQLDRMTLQTRQLVQPERLETTERAVAELLASEMESRIALVGSIAPEFSLPDNNNRKVKSSDLLALGPVIVNFFRGRWCAYCIAELEAWREAYPAVRERGALLVAISPQTIHQTDLLSQERALPFPVLSDPGAAVAESFHIAYTVPEYQQTQYRSILINLPFLNGEPSWRLPLPATFVIRPDGVIGFAEAHADFRVRPDPKEVLAALG